ncbi:MAG: nitroreductase family protein [Clostridia bacterium]|nr:nitroreductase family protein [Clostridia bacterium]
MENSIVINTEKCIGCSKCVKDCVSYRIKLIDSKAVFGGGKCLECGHCYAVCPEGAVTMPDYDVTECEKTADLKEFNSDSFLLALKSRRSVRQYKDEIVSKEDIMKILEAGRYSPTGTNMQDLHYTVITESLPELEAHAVKVFRKLKNGASPLSKYLGSIDIDDKFFSKGATAAIIISGKSKTNACIASAYMELMAENLGLGVLYSGFFLSAMKLSPKIKKKVAFPSGLTPYVCLFIGETNVKYKRLVPRKELSARFI